MDIAKLETLLNESLSKQKLDVSEKELVELNSFSVKHGLKDFDELVKMHKMFMTQATKKSIINLDGLKELKEPQKLRYRQVVEKKSRSGILTRAFKSE